jgi:oligopeptide transport system ATP-binding protein
MAVAFKTQQGALQAVRGIDFSVERGEILGIVGESGSGKSVAMLSLMGLLADNGRLLSGEITFDGENISPPPRAVSRADGPFLRERVCGALAHRRVWRAYRERMRTLRGREAAMIFQDPMTYLNPVLKIGVQMTEGLRLHKKCGRREAYGTALSLLRQVGITSPEQRMRQYPFELSGGMRQRIIVAIALSCGPKLLIADEPTTALDVTIQAQLLDLIRTMTRESRTSVIMITHDLGIVATMCDRIAIMYAGEIVEEGCTDEIFYTPMHPYTVGLLGSIANTERSVRQALVPIPGTPPDLLHLTGGCAFAPRCAEAMNICLTYRPEPTGRSRTQRCRCWKYCAGAAREIVERQIRSRGGGADGDADFGGGASLQAL